LVVPTNTMLENLRLAVEQRQVLVSRQNRSTSASMSSSSATIGAFRLDPARHLEAKGGRAPDCRRTGRCRRGY